MFLNGLTRDRLTKQNKNETKNVNSLIPTQGEIFVCKKWKIDVFTSFLKKIVFSTSGQISDERSI